MRAILCEAHGMPEDLAFRDLAVPQPGEGEVRIRVAAAGVNFPDALMIQNKYQVQPALPFSPGGEAAGWIDSIGEVVSGWSICDRVAAMTVSGAFAEQVIVKADRVLSLPDAVPFDVAAVFTTAYGTAFHALKDRGQLKPGEAVLVLGASGGVGLAAVEVAKAMGAHVVAAASSQEKLALAQVHGADMLVDYSGGDLRAALKAAVGSRPIDVIYDPVGGALSEAAFRSIGRYGRHLVIGFAAGDVPSIAINLPLLKAASVVGVFWGSFTVIEPEGHRANMAQLYAWLGEGKINPLISRRFPLEQAAEALRCLIDRAVLGKVVVTVAAD